MDYGHGGVGPVTSGLGVALLPNTSGSRLLFGVALTLIAVGAATLTVSAIAAYKRHFNRG